MSLRDFPERFLLAFSFAGPYRDLVRKIAEAAEQQLGLGTVFYDEWYTAEIAGADADLKLQKIYGDRSEVVVPCFSGPYDERLWTQVEWTSIRARMNRLRVAGEGEIDRILPIRVGEGPKDELRDATTIWLDATREPPPKLAELFLQRVRKFAPDAGKLRVFLAQTIDLEDELKPVSRPVLQRFLEEQCACGVFPKGNLIDDAADNYRDELQKELQQSHAFIQLLSGTLWTGGRFDEVQFRAAQTLERPLYCFQGDIPTESIKDGKQKAFIESTQAVKGQFQDFKQDIQKKLKALQEIQKAAIRKQQESDRRRDPEGGDAAASDDTQPLIRVAIRAGDGNAIWDPVFQFLDGEQKVLLDDMGPQDSFLSKHAAEPCHGFLILCDERAQQDEELSPRDALAQCRQIQTELGKKGSPCIPPVAVVFRAPPDPVWSRLLRSTPKCLSRVMGNDLKTGLTEFLEQTRQVMRAQP